MKTKTIRQTILIPEADPLEIYEILMDEKKHAKLVSSTAKISRQVGGRFEVYDGYIEGTNIELVPDKKIVQNWRGEEDCWPKDHFSKITLDLEKEGNGTKISLLQEGVPADCVQDFDQGWYEFYWNPMQALFKK